MLERPRDSCKKVAVGKTFEVTVSAFKEVVTSVVGFKTKGIVPVHNVLFVE